MLDFTKKHFAFKICFVLSILFFTSCVIKEDKNKQKVENNTEQKRHKNVIKKTKPNNKNSNGWVDIVRKDYSIKYPKYCELDSRPKNGKELIIYEPKTKNSKNPTKIYITKIELKKTISSTIDFFLNKEKKIWKKFKLINKTEDGYFYSKFSNGEYVNVYHKLRVKDNFAYVFTFEANAKNFPNHKKIGMKILNNFKVK